MFVVKVRSFLETRSADHQIECDCLTAEPVDALADKDPGVRQPDLLNLQDLPVDPIPLPTGLDHPIVLCRETKK